MPPTWIGRMLPRTKVLSTFGGETRQETCVWAPLYLLPNPHPYFNCLWQKSSKCPFPGLTFLIITFTIDLKEGYGSLFLNYSHCNVAKLVLGNTSPALHLLVNPWKLLLIILLALLLYFLDIPFLNKKKDFVQSIGWFHKQPTLVLSGQISSKTPKVTLFSTYPLVSQLGKPSNKK